MEVQLQVNLDIPSKAEISTALKLLRDGKSAGPDGIPGEALRAGDVTAVDVLHWLLGKVWEEEKVPRDWTVGQLVKLPVKGDLQDCQNYLGISLLFVPSKILSRAILERLREAPCCGYKAA